MRIQAQEAHAVAWNPIYGIPRPAWAVRRDFACASSLKMYQILRLDKANPPLPANRYFKYSEVIAIYNAPGTLFFRFLILFGPFIVPASPINSLGYSFAKIRFQERDYSGLSAIRFHPLESRRYLLSILRRVLYP